LIGINSHSKVILLKIALYKTDGRVFATDVSAKFEVTSHWN